jgi:hypothetical protein
MECLFPSAKGSFCQNETLLDFPKAAFYFGEIEKQKKEKAFCCSLLKE